MGQEETSIVTVKVDGHCYVTANDDAANKVLTSAQAVPLLEQSCEDCVSSRKLEKALRAAAPHAAVSTALL